MPVLSTIVAVLLLILATAAPAAGVAATAAQGHAPDLATTPTATTGWTVTGSDEIPAASGPLALSPDGARLFALDPVDPARACILTIATAAACDDTGYGQPNAILDNSITWAPDSSAVAFGLNVPMLGIDPDILVIDAATGVIANLTDDGDTALTDGLPYDVYPSWSRDGMSLAFQRLTIGEPGSLALMRVPRTGGEPTTLAAMPEDQELRLNAPLRQLPDDSWLFSSGFRMPGISRLAPDGSIHTLVDGDPDGDYPNPILASVAADGEWAAFATTVGRENSANAGKVAFIDLESNAVIPIDVAGAPRVLPIFSPDGRDLLFVTEERDVPATAWLVPAGEATPVELARIDPPAESLAGLAAMPLQPAVGWSRANTILVHTYTNTVILTVARKA